MKIIIINFKKILFT